MHLRGSQSSQVSRQSWQETRRASARTEILPSHLMLGLSLACQKKSKKGMKKGTGGSDQSFWPERETLDDLLYSSLT